MLSPLAVLASAAALALPATALADAGFGGLDPASAPAHVVAPKPGPYAGLARASIPRRYGRHGNGLRYWISLARIPRAVPRDRWRALARVAGARWGMRAIGDTNRRVIVGDGYPEVGFGSVPRGALGLEVTYKVNGRVFDRDILLRTDVAWQPGPARPDSRHYDLESVVLHEMGHMAGNGWHDPRCDPAPLENGLAPGWWWRSPVDWSFAGCSATTGPPLGGGASAKVIRGASATGPLLGS